MQDWVVQPEAALVEPRRGGSLALYSQGQGVFMDATKSGASLGPRIFSTSARVQTKNLPSTPSLSASSAAANPPWVVPSSLISQAQTLANSS